jgi:hypothetical protein
MQSVFLLSLLLPKTGQSTSEEWMSCCEEMMSVAGGEGTLGAPCAPTSCTCRWGIKWHGQSAFLVILQFFFYHVGIAFSGREIVLDDRTRAIHGWMSDQLMGDLNPPATWSMGHGRLVRWRTLVRKVKRRRATYNTCSSVAPGCYCTGALEGGLLDLGYGSVRCLLKNLGIASRSGRLPPVMLGSTTKDPMHYQINLLSQHRIEYFPTMFQILL